jgi:O-antigen ligase
MLGLAAFFALGVVALLRGILSGAEVTRSFRDFSMVVYPAFVLVGLHMLVKWESLERVGLMLIVGAAMASLNGVAWFVATPGLRRYIAYGIWITIAIVGVAVAMIRRLLRPSLGIPIVVLLTLGLFVANARTLYVVLGVAGLLFLLSGRHLGKRVDRRSLFKIVGAVAIIIVATVTFLTQTKAGQDYVAQETEQLVSGVAHSEDDDNAQFRVLAWGEAALRFAAQPVMGEGYGIPFTFELAEGDARPHNTYLTVLYKMGVTGILPLLFTLGYVLWKAIQVFRRSGDDPHGYVLHLLLLAQVMLCAYGVLNLLLESPFLASLFWLNLGMCWRATLLLRNGVATAQIAA